MVEAFRAPILVSDRAAGVMDIVQSHLAVGLHIDVLGEAAAVAVHELKEGLIEIAPPSAS